MGIPELYIGADSETLRIHKQRDDMNSWDGLRMRRVDIRDHLSRSIVPLSLTVVYGSLKIIQSLSLQLESSDLISLRT